MKEVEVKILDVNRKKVEDKLISLGAKKIFDDEMYAILFDNEKNKFGKGKVYLFVNR